jgi:hypothetical protein
LCLSAVFLLFDHNSKKNGSNGFSPHLLPFTTILDFLDRFEQFQGVLDEYQPIGLQRVLGKQKQRKNCSLS